MKRILFPVVVGLCACLSFGALLETTSEAERMIDQRYTTERSHHMALKKLDTILEDAALSDADKEKRIRAAFLTSSELTSENIGDLLLYMPILSWRVHSLAVAYDLDGRYESIVSRDRLTETKTTQTAGSNEERTRSENRTSTGENSGTLHGEAGLMFGIFPKLTANADAKMMKTVSNTSSRGNQSAWTRQDQASLNARYESVMKELAETKLSGLHIRFVVEFSNNTGKDMVVPAGSVVPVYAGSASFSVMAKMESAVALNIPAYGTVDIAFRGDLATTAARELIDFMRTKSPVIAPERSPLLVIRSVDGTVRNAVNEAMRVASTKIVCGAYTWNVRRTWNGKPVTIQQALEAVNARYDAPPFVWEGRKLKTICGAAVEPFDLERIPCVETDEGIVIGWNDISKPLAVDELRFGVMKADAFIVGKGRRWNDLAKEGQAKLIARLRNLESDATVQYLLGVCYENGLGVDKSSEKAVEYYRKSAEQKNSRAQYNLGVYYYNGWCVGQSYTEAVKWWYKSAEQGNARAQYNLGVSYYNGRGVERSHVEAVKWYRKSAEQGDVMAQNNLGTCYANGWGVEQSYAEAVKWYRKSAEQGNATAQCNLGSYYAIGQSVEQSHEEAVRWYHRAAEQGDADAQNELGYYYERGQGVERSYTEAVKWYRTSAEQGNAAAQCNLGSCYDEGRGVERSYTEAVKWYYKSAKQGHARAQNNLGVCYANGLGVERSYTEAVKWYYKSAEQGNAVAQCNLGSCYDEGRGVERSYTEAVKWYRKSAEQGCARAQESLGVCYANGEGVEKSVRKAMYWLRKAKENGVELNEGQLRYMERHKDE